MVGISDFVMLMNKSLLFLQNELHLFMFEFITLKIACAKWERNKSTNSKHSCWKKPITRMYLFPSRRSMMTHAMTLWIKRNTSLQLIYVWQKTNPHVLCFCLLIVAHNISVGCLTKALVQPLLFSTKKIEKVWFKNICCFIDL